MTETLTEYLQADRYHLQGRAANYLAACEQLSTISDGQVVGIDGPTCSGKSSLGTALSAHLFAQGAKVSLLPLDLFPAGRAERTTAIDRMRAGRMSVASYSAAAWDLVAYRKYIDKAKEIIQGRQDSWLTPTDVYDRACGSHDMCVDVPVYAGGVILLEGVGVHLHQADLCDVKLRTDVRQNDILLERELRRERFKPLTSRLSDTFLTERHHLVDGPHAEYLRQQTAGIADIVVDTTVGDDILIYSKQPGE